MSLVDTLKKSLGFEEEHVEPVADYSTGVVDHDYYISPEQPFYEIVLIRPKSVDDMDYIYDQIVEETNPVIIDLGYLENEGPDAFAMAGEKIKILRKQHGAEAISLCNGAQKRIIVLSPYRINIIKKE